MATVILPPEKFEKVSRNDYHVFLSGSMGEWRQKVIEYFKDFPNTLVFLDPTRNDWNDSWGKDKVKEQIFWELNGIEQADVTAIYLEKDAFAPISLLEMGVSTYHNDVFVFCEDGFWRKDNVMFTAEFFDIPVVENLEEFCLAIESRFFHFEKDRKVFQLIN